MATYIALIDYTPQGVRDIKDSPARAAAFAESAKKAGITVKDLYWTTGGHDGVLILEAPDDKSVFSLILSLGRAGNVRTMTMRAFGREEMQEILAKTS